MTLRELLYLIADKEQVEQQIEYLQQNETSYKNKTEVYESKMRGLQTYLEELLDTPISGEGD